MAISQKSCSGCSGGSIFHNLRVQIAKKNRPKIDHKTEHKMECTLASINIRFWSVSVCKFGWKTIQNRCRKTSKIVMLLGRSRVRPWRKAVYPFPSSGNTQGSGNPRPRCLSRSWSDFFAILVTFLFSSLLRCLFGSMFARFSTPTCFPKSTKIVQKSMPRCLPMLNSLFDQFLIDFGSQLGSPEPNLELAG